MDQTQKKGKIKKNSHSPDSVAQLFGHCPTKQSVTGWLLVRAHAWVVGSVPGWGAYIYERQQIDVSLSH